MTRHHQMPWHAAAADVHDDRLRRGLEESDSVVDDKQKADDVRVNTHGVADHSINCA